MLRPEQRLLREMVSSACEYCKSYQSGGKDSNKEYRENVRFLREVDERFLIAAGFAWPAKMKQSIRSLLVA